MGLFSMLSGATAQERMLERLPAIDALKAAGVIGETKAGYVEAREPLSAGQEEIVNGENADRKELYSIVAQKTGQSVAEVGTQRAIRNVTQAKVGVWVQDSRGRWYQKK